MANSSKEKNRKKVFFIKILNNFYFAIFFILSISAISTAAKTLSEDASGNLSTVETIFFSIAETLIIAISVSIILSLMDKYIRENKISRVFDKYEDVLAAAELLHNSKKKNGLAGIVESPEEKNIFDQFNEDYKKDNAPEIWWMNFRIEQYDTFKKSIRDFVQRGGNVRIITTHPENPNIPFRLEEAYPKKDLKDYIDHLRIQARTFIKLNEEVKDFKGSFDIFFNKKSPAYPVFIVKHDLDYKAYSGFYLNDISGNLPYIVWDTAEKGMVQKFIDYMKYKMNTAESSDDVLQYLESTEADYINSSANSRRKPAENPLDFADAMS